MNRHHPIPQAIRTDCLCLRGPTLHDASAIFHSYAQDSQVCRFLVWRPHVSEADTQAFVASCVHALSGDDCMPFVITERQSNLAIGMFDVRVQGSAVELGYVLARAHWGKGFMPEAIAVCGASEYFDRASCALDLCQMQVGAHWITQQSEI
jgi:ribosomal-protein-alanine N-acetyltransferase